MNRQTKFRAYNTTNKEMWDGDHLILNGIYVSPSTGRLIDVRNGDFIHIQELIPLEYTSLKDKNGKEIYEGDIILHNQGKSVVEFYKGMFVLIQKNRSNTPWDKWWNVAKYIEVIGNVFENPELIK